mmetsp:Transcript_3366/g.11304  ORF Transcript_3366/g.11304 Transcript_3366/m.11304 type:complete len:109 (+) Transcript_3366:88-414(+)
MAHADGVAAEGDEDKHPQEEMQDPINRVGPEQEEVKAQQASCDERRNTEAQDEDAHCRECGSADYFSWLSGTSTDYAGRESQRRKPKTQAAACMLATVLSGLVMIVLL